MKKLLQVLVVLIIIVGIIMLAFSYVDGYPVGYPIYIGYPVDVGYPVYDHYPVTGYSEPLPGYPIEIGYQVYTPMPMQDYPEPGASSPELVSNPVQLEPILPQYVNGRNLWQEIVYQFSRLLELMK